MRASHDCDTFARVSRDNRGIFVRVSYNVRANFNQFYFSELSLKMVLFMSHICRIVQVAETSLRCVYERLRRVGDGFATYAMTWRRFCDDFCRTKKYYMFKTWRTVRDEFAMHARTLRSHANVSRRFCESIDANPSRTCRIPVRKGLNLSCKLFFVFAYGG